MTENFYIVSLKWTYPNSAAFTFWGKNRSGYRWRVEEAGLYSKEEIEKHPDYFNNRLDTIAVPEKIIDSLKEKATYEKKESYFVLNTQKSRKLIGISKDQLKGGMSNIRIEELEFKN